MQSALAPLEPIRERDRADESMARIKSFLKNSEIKSLSRREGGALVETLILLGFCGFCPLWAWAATNSHRRRAKSKGNIKQ
jgi:hypothetical protein